MCVCVGGGGGENGGGGEYSKKLFANNLHTDGLERKGIEKEEKMFFSRRLAKKRT